MAAKKATNENEIPVEERLRTLYLLQTKLTEIDKIKTLRGELPLEVADLDDEIAGLKIRVEKNKADLKEAEANVTTQKQKIQDATAKIEKYKGQLDNVRNNREFDHLTKEVEFESLEIELAEKRIREFSAEVKTLGELIAKNEELLSEKSADLTHKKDELDEIVSETKHQEEVIREEVKNIETKIDARLLTAFRRIRKSARNGLAIVTLQRGACGGCFNKIPPQRQLDIKMGKKIIVCEYCGRIMVDEELMN